MKMIICLLALWASTHAWGQPAHQSPAFSALKKTVILPTGIRMKYIDTGNAAGMPVILLHGSTDTGRSFGPAMEELTRIDGTLRIIAPDLRGHGETSLPDSSGCAGAPELCFTPTDFARDILALMDGLGIAETHLVGHSMGSIIAQELALTQPGRVRSVVLIGTFVNGKTCRAIHDFLQATVVDEQFKSALLQRPGFRWPRDAYRVTPSALGPAVKTFLRENWVVEMGVDAAYLQAIYQETIRVPLGTWIGMIKALGTVDNRERMADLTVPTLVLFPIQDVMVPALDQQQVKTALQGASTRHGTPIFYKTYGKTPLPASGRQESDFGHNLQWAAPKQVAADIASFVQTGVPVFDLSYLHPENPKQVVTYPHHANIITFGPRK
jgi:pimeloyl-ACP methyl ester carboxylesterase